MKLFSTLLTLMSALIVFCLTGCTGTDGDGDPKPSSGVSDNLHFAFKTPDWERTIDCTHLDLDPFYASESLYYVFATSASTKNTFYLSFPSDSSELVKPSNLNKYEIREVGDITEGPFHFAFKVPKTPNGNYLISQQGLSDDSYNEIVSIHYAGADDDLAVFSIKGKYKMNATELDNESNVRPISGTYHFKIKVNRK